VISLYLTRKTWAHRLPAASKLIGLAALSFAVLPVENLGLLSLLFVLVLAAYASLGREGLRVLLTLTPLVLALVLIAALHWLNGSLVMGLITVLRLSVMVLLANFVSVTTRMDDMLAVVMKVFAPLQVFGFSPRKPALAVTLVLRFAPVLLAIFYALGEAHRARTGQRGSWRLVAPFALQSLALADHVAEALTARGGAGGMTSGNASRKG